MASDFLPGMTHPVLLPVVDLPLDHPAVGSLLAKLPVRGTPFAVSRDPSVNAGACYYAVEAAVRTSGGRRRDGWMLEVVPGVYCQAMHHAVWERPDGGLVDLTSPRIARTGDTTFVGDQVTKVDIRFPPLIEIRHHVLVDDPDVEQALSAYRRNNRAQKKMAVTLRAAGYRFDPIAGWLPRSSSLTNVEASMRRGEAESDATYAEVQRLNAVIMKRYFTSSTRQA
jgi:hypothetical protein